MHQINYPNDKCYGPDAPSLNMEIACSESTTVRTLGQHHWDATQFMKEFQRNLESQSYSCPSGRLMSTIRTAPRYFNSDAHLMSTVRTAPRYFNSDAHLNL
jgi:hypothetical protein